MIIDANCSGGITSERIIHISDLSFDVTVTESGKMKTKREFIIRAKLPNGGIENFKYDEIEFDPEAESDLDCDKSIRAGTINLRLTQYEVLGYKADTDELLEFILKKTNSVTMKHK